MKGKLTDRFKKAIFGEGGRTEKIELPGFFDKNMLTEFVEACVVAKIDCDYAVDCILACVSTRLNNGSKRDVAGYVGHVRPNVKNSWDTAIKENHMKGFYEVNSLLKELLSVNTPDELNKKLLKFNEEYESGKGEK